MTTPPEAPPMREDVTQASKFVSWDTGTLVAQCRMQARDSLDPEYVQFMCAVADRLAHTAQDGYATAFYEIAALLGIPARAASPAEVWRDEMRPKLEALVTRDEGEK